MTPDDLHAEGVGLLRSFPWRQALGMRLVQYANAWWYDRKRLEEAEKVVSAAQEFKASIDDALLHPKGDRAKELQREQDAQVALMEALDALAGEEK